MVVTKAEKRRQALARGARVKDLRNRLANLTEDERRQMLARGLVATVEGHELSPRNTMLVYLQANGRSPSVVGGYQQWCRAGKQVRKGEHGMMIWVPTQPADEDGEPEGDTRFITGHVFDITQVDDIKAEEEKGA